MAWYDIPGVNCLFALDSDSEITEHGFKVLLSNNSNFLTVEGLNKKDFKIQKGVSLAWDVRNFIPETYSKSFYRYKTLRIDNKNLIFNTPVLFSETTKQLTVVLKAKLKSSSGFLNSDSSTINSYGLLYTNNDSISVNNFWRFSGMTSESILASGYNSSERRSNFSLVFDTVVLRLDWGERKGSLETTYGIFSLDFDSIFTDTNFFIKGGSIKMLGSPNPSWNLDADIVSYGAFDKVLTSEQLDSVLKEIDRQFLVSLEEKNTFEPLKGIIPKDSPGSSVFTPNCTPLKELESVFSKEVSNADSVLYPSKEFNPNTFEDFTLIHKNELDFFNESKRNVLALHRELKGRVASFDAPQGSTFTLEGLITEEDIPVSVQLYIYNKKTGELVSKTTSNKLGEYSFEQLDKTLEYFVTAYDKKYQYKSIIQDYNTQENI